MRALIRASARAVVVLGLASRLSAHVLSQGGADLAVADDVVAVALTVDRSAMLLGIGRGELVARADADTVRLTGAFTAYVADALRLAGDDGVERPPDEVAWLGERWNPLAPGGRLGGRYAFELRWHGLRAQRRLTVRSRLHLASAFAEHTQLALRAGAETLMLSPGATGAVALERALGGGPPRPLIAVAAAILVALTLSGGWALRRASARRRDSPPSANRRR